MNSSITQDVFEAVLIRPVITVSGEHPGLVHLWWSAPEQGDRFVQVYVDGLLTDVTIDPLQREMWLICDRSRSYRVDLLAINMSRPDLLWQSHFHIISCGEPPTADIVEVAILRSESLPVDTVFTILVDDESIDKGAVWPATEHRGGFGALFGEGEFGHDASTGMGLGVGELGMGPLGTDGTAWRWRKSGLSPGSHLVDVTATDRTGQAVAEEVSIGSVEINALPKPASSLFIDPDFTLHWAV